MLNSINTLSGARRIQPKNRIAQESQQNSQKQAINVSFQGLNAMSNYSKAFISTNKVAFKGFKDQPEEFNYRLADLPTGEYVFGNYDEGKIIEMPLKSPLFSRKHFKLTVNAEAPPPERYSIQDLGSRNGTYIERDGFIKTLQAKEEPTPLKPGDTISLSKLALRISPEGQIEINNPGLFHDPGNGTIINKADGSCLAPAKEFTHALHLFPLDQYSIGRQNNLSIVIPDDLTVSKEHCTLKTDLTNPDENKRITIKDLDSTHGTFISFDDGKTFGQIPSGEDLPLKAGNIVRLGESNLLMKVSENGRGIDVNFPDLIANSYMVINNNKTEQISPMHHFTRTGRVQANGTYQVGCGSFVEGIRIKPENPAIQDLHAVIIKKDATNDIEPVDGNAVYINGEQIKERTRLHTNDVVSFTPDNANGAQFAINSHGELLTNDPNLFGNMTDITPIKIDKASGSLKFLSFKFEKLTRVKGNGNIPIGRNVKSEEGGISIHDFLTSTSRDQATLKFENGKFSIADNNSFRGTYVNGERIKSGEENRVQLKEGDIVTFAKTLLDDKHAACIKIGKSGQLLTSSKYAFDVENVIRPKQ